MYSLQHLPRSFQKCGKSLQPPLIAQTFKYATTFVGTFSIRLVTISGLPLLQQQVHTLHMLLNATEHRPQYQ